MFSDGDNHRVSVFTSDGVFVSSFGRSGSGHLTPGGLIFDKDGYILS